MITESSSLESVPMEAPIGEIPFLSLAGHDLFARRGERFRQLAPGHPWGDYLSFLGLLADAQQEALNRFLPLPAPDPRELKLCHEHGMPPLGCSSWVRNRAWREGLTLILRQLAGAPLPSAARETLNDLMSADETNLEGWADSILAVELDRVSPRVLPFVAAALQVYWVRMAISLGAESFSRPEQGGICPVCGSHPVVGIVGSRGGRNGVRYLCCSLCSSQWHLVRIKCSSCEATEGIIHYALEGSQGAVKAESCDACGSYLKLFYQAQDGRFDPVADDLATLSLDMLMTREKNARRGANLFFHPGAA
jgi:FdhE protein